jgi:fructosamine-3-kinase
MNEHRIDYEIERMRKKKRTQLNHDRVVVREQKRMDNHYRSSAA